MERGLGLNRPLNSYYTPLNLITPTLIIDEENCCYDEEKEQGSDYENLPDHISNTKRLSELAEEVRYRTGT